jgi:hypothetical protein
VHNHLRTHGSEGATEPGRDGPGPLRGSVRPPFPCTRRIFNPKVLDAPPFVEERATRTEMPSTSWRERREISGGGATISKEAPRSGEEGRHRRKHHHDQQCYVQHLDGVIFSFVHGLSSILRCNHTWLNIYHHVLNMLYCLRLATMP